MNVPQLIPISVQKASAETLALARLRDEDNPSQWLTLIEVNEDVDLDEGLAYLKQRGYNLSFSLHLVNL